MVARRDVDWRPAAEALPWAIIAFAAGFIADRAERLSTAIQENERQRIPPLLDEIEVAVGVLNREWQGTHYHPPGTLEFLIDRWQHRDEADAEDYAHTPEMRAFLDARPLADPPPEDERG